MSKRGGPPKFVKDPNGRPIVGLSYCKTISAGIGQKNYTPKEQKSCSEVVNYVMKEGRNRINIFM